MRPVTRPAFAVIGVPTVSDPDSEPDADFANTCTECVLLSPCFPKLYQPEGVSVVQFPEPLAIDV
jgi:hypothetical protein